MLRIRRNPCMTLVAQVLGSWAGEVPIPNPDHEFSDDQLAKWLTAPSSGNTAEDFAEDEWHEGTGDNGMVCGWATCRNDC